jgi:hypothetical protein
MSEETKDSPTDVWDATVYTGLYCLLQCFKIRHLYAESVDLSELDIREKSLIRAVEFAMEMLAIPDLLEEFRLNVRDESGQLSQLWIESHGMIFAARHPVVTVQFKNDRLAKSAGDESSIELNAALTEWRKIANPPIPEHIEYLGLMVLDDCRMPDQPEWRAPGRLIGLLIAYWNVLKQAVKITQDIMMTCSPHPLTSMLVNLRLRMDEIVELLSESEDLTEISETLQFLWDPLFQENGAEQDDFQAVPEIVGTRFQQIQLRLERVRLKQRGKFPPVKTFAEEYFLKAAELGVVSYREQIAEQNRRVRDWAKNDLPNAKEKYRKEQAKESQQSENQPNKPFDATPTLPRWDLENRILHFGTQIARRVDSKARRLIVILNAFQEEVWPPRIDDPLPGGRDPERLRDALGTLNTNLKFLRFEADGTGEGIRWSSLESQGVPL